MEKYLVSTAFDFRFEIIIEYLPFFFDGMLVTIGVSLVGIFLGTLLGLFICLGQLYGHPIIHWLTRLFINFFRGTPLLVQIFIIHFGLMKLIIDMLNTTGIFSESIRSDPIISAIVALSLHSSAYIAEILRAGIEGIDRGQMEAARSLGMSRWQALRYVILPQALRQSIPSLGNEFIILIKDSSLMASIAAQELFYWGRAAASQYFTVWEPYLTIALIYLAINLLLVRLLRWLEIHLRKE